MQSLLELTGSFVPLLLTVVAVALILFVANRLLIGRHPELGGERKIARQLAMLGLSVIGLVTVALSLPVDESMRKQIVALIGVLLSGVLAFSSTTLIASFMAGLMLHVTKPFRTGDFVRVGEFFGRISEQGLFDTEIQTEQRELVHLSNMFMVSNPVTVVRSSGAIVSASLSLGYDIHHSRVHELLLAAAEKTALDDAFVQIMELGNDSITYRISGLLVEVKSLLTARSNLYRNILDALHGDGIEIVSPTFMNQRRLPDGAQIVPPTPKAAPLADTAAGEEFAPEDIVFDKAEKAERDEQARQALKDAIAELENQLEGAKGKEKQHVTALIEQAREQLEELERQVEEKAEKAEAGEKDGGNRSARKSKSPATLQSSPPAGAQKPEGK